MDRQNGRAQSLQCCQLGDRKGIRIAKKTCLNYSPVIVFFERPYLQPQSNSGKEDLVNTYVRVYFVLEFSFSYGEFSVFLLSNKLSASF